MNLPDLRGVPEIAIDTETRDDGLASGKGPGWATGAGYVAGVSLAWGDNAIYLPTRHPDSDNLDIGPWVRDLFRQDETNFILFNSSYDIGWLQTDYGVITPRRFDDAAIQIAMLDENRLSYSLDDVCRDYGVQGKDETLLNVALKERGLKGKGSLHKLPAALVAPYAEQDARATLHLYHALKPLLEAEETVDAYRLEVDLIPLIIEMRRRGLRIDVDMAEQAVQRFARERDATLLEISRQIGQQVTMETLRSPGWLLKTFTAESIGFPRTEKGNASFTAKWMKKHPHWLPKMITRAKQYEDASSKFFANYILGYAHKGRVHPNINSFLAEEGGTRSYRMSYTAPALQQAPARDGEFADVFRGAFLPEPGDVWGALDFSQQELRIIVHYAERMGLRGALEAAEQFRNDPATDFHTMVADMTGLERGAAKAVNFAKVYGAGLAQFCAMTDMDATEAKQTMEQYDRRLPFMKRISEACNARAREKGYIRLIDGALCHFPQWESSVFGAGGKPTTREEALLLTRTELHPWYGHRIKRAHTFKALNRLVQGGAARQIKKAMLDCWREGIVPLLTIHDELGFSFGSEAQALRAKDIMVNAIKLTVPMKVDAEFGVSWGDSMKKHKWSDVIRPS